MSPRSILKRSPDAAHHHHHQHPSPSHASFYNSALPYPPNVHVHFPPQTSLTQTFTTHSGATYDRAPIVVLPNDCELPERGCPGRTFDGLPQDIASSSSSCRSSRRDCRSSRMSAGAQDVDVRKVSSRPPPLVPDLSSESDESDGLISPPEFSNSNATSLSLSHHHPLSHSIPQTQEHFDKALAFLPHSPPTTKDRSKRRSSPATSKPRFKSEAGARSFAASSLDGCLGGF